ncbi:MAG: sodium-dependent transporter [Euryarchaeota archaeon]|nr:sodium-dependent transporter [Euryarchaeota archaeon]MCD6158048.1 sodium-dependent transporter [Euryarchaeota archaeon]
MAPERERWATRLGLILAMAGNAIGLGNFWRFPYQLAKNGGGAFLIPYFIALFLLGIPLMWTEWTVGRYSGQHGHGTLGPAFYLMSRKSLGPTGALVFGMIGGMLAFAVTTLLNSYYIHVIGWTAAYFGYSIAGSYYGVDTVKFFGQHVSNLKAVLLSWLISLALLGLCVGRGVSRGIEKWATIMMPILYIAAIILVIRAFTLGSPVKPEWSSLAGFNYIWKPDFETLKSNFFTISLAAAGQIFFTLSLGMGIIQNYASYLRPEDDIVASGFATTALNEFAEVILGGSIAIPIAFAFLGPKEAIKGGVGLAFMALPNVFTQMGSAGRFFGALWFLLLWFAGFTSAIAMYNYLVALLEEDLKIKRTLGSLLVFILYFLLGLPVAIDSSLTYLSELDNWVGSYILVVLGFFDIIVGVWLFLPKRYWEELHKGALMSVPKVYYWITAVVAPAYIAFLLVGTTWDYYVKGIFAQTGTWIIAARVAIILVMIIGALEAYLAIKRKYG